MREPTRVPTPITTDWTPDPELVDRLASECRGLVDLDHSHRRFKNHHIEKATRSRAWDAKFENWVLADLDRAQRERGVTEGTDRADEYGIRPWQHDRMNRAVIEQQRAMEFARSFLHATPEQRAQMRAAQQTA